MQIFSIAYHRDLSWSEYNRMNNGNYDNIHDCKYRIPDYWDIGEVYERLIEDCFSDDEILHGIWKVYHSWISDKI